MIKTYLFRTLHFFVLGEKGDLGEPTGRNKKYTRSQEQRLNLSRKVITWGNVWLLRISRGHLGNSFMGRPVLLLTTIGRKSGKPRSQPVYFMRDGERVVLVASNAGSSHDPFWLSNARVNPIVSIAERGNIQKMTLRIASEEEETQLWPRLLAVFPNWQDGRDCCWRKIPVVLLEPCDSAAAASATSVQ